MEDLIRWANAGLGVIGFLWLMQRLYAHWPEYPYAFKMQSLVLSFFIFGVAYGSVEAVAQNLPFGTRTIIYFVAIVAHLITLGVTERYSDVRSGGRRGA